MKYEQIMDKIEVTPEMRRVSSAMWKQNRQSRRSVS